MTEGELIFILGAFLLCSTWAFLLMLRELRDRTDGLRTLGWVAVAAALFVFLAAVAARQLAPLVDQFF